MNFTNDNHLKPFESIYHATSNFITVKYKSQICPGLRSFSVGSCDCETSAAKHKFLLKVSKEKLKFILLRNFEEFSIERLYAYKYIYI